MSEKMRNLIGIVLFILFVSMMLVGMNTPELKTVLNKATSICMECIGIG